MKYLIKGSIIGGLSLFPVVVQVLDLYRADGFQAEPVPKLQPITFAFLSLLILTNESQTHFF